jgi:Zn-dependent M28 family amino/carboxypeptidase
MGTLQLRRRATRKWFVPLAVSAIVAGLVGPATADPVDRTREFRRAVTVRGIRQHQAAFQEIADAHGGTRAAGTSGYEASVDYVVDRLERAGYTPEVQEFTFGAFSEGEAPELEQTAPVNVTFTPGLDADFIAFTGSGEVSAPITPVDLQMPPNPVPNSSTSACETEDFAGFPAGNIALVQRGTCPYVQKAANAQAAGAGGLIIFNEGQPGRTAVPENLPLGAPGVTIPSVGTSFAVGDALDEAGTAARIKTDVVEEQVPTWNVIAETRSGDPNRTVVVGAHLDSVPAGPGINDNGSGSGAILEVAEEYAEAEIRAQNKLRFIWFGAEELGLLGSAHYVSGLSAEEQADIMAMLNFDMIGSPNYVRFVYDGDGSAGPVGPTGSGFIEDVFVDYFDSQGLANDPTPFNGRSDYGPFIATGIPAGGLFTGAEQPKTEEQAAVYGGTVGEQLDPCYHAVCDTFANVSIEVLDQMSDAVAHAVLFLSKTDIDVRSIPN